MSKILHVAVREFISTVATKGFIIGVLLTPIILVIAFFQIAILQQPIPNFLEILLGTMFVVVGLALFVRGLDLGLFPIGETMAHVFARKGFLAETRKGRQVGAIDLRPIPGLPGAHNHQNACAAWAKR